MENKLLSIALLTITSFTFAQGGKTLWKSTVKKIDAVTYENKKNIKNPQLFELDVNYLKQTLSSSPKRFTSGAKSNVTILFPVTNGQFENFRIQESSNMAPELAANYPEIKSYIGIGIDNPTSTLYFSISPLGFKSMQLMPENQLCLLSLFPQI
jgi:hypothetical protein